MESSEYVFFPPPLLAHRELIQYTAAVPRKRSTRTELAQERRNGKIRQRDLLRSSRHSFLGRFSLRPPDDDADPVGQGVEAESRLGCTAVGFEDYFSRTDWDQYVSLLSFPGDTGTDAMCVALVLRGGVAGPFLAIADQSARLWLFKNLERVVVAHNAKKISE